MDSGAAFGRLHTTPHHTTPPWTGLGLELELELGLSLGLELYLEQARAGAGPDTIQPLYRWLHGAETQSLFPPSSKAALVRYIYHKYLNRGYFWRRGALLDYLPTYLPPYLVHPSSVPFLFGNAGAKDGASADVDTSTSTSTRLSDYQRGNLV